MRTPTNLPPILDLVVELGIKRMRSFVGDEDGNPFRPRICVWVDHASGMILHFALSEPGQTEEILVATSFNKLVGRLKGAPRQVVTNKPSIALMMNEHLKPHGIDVIVRESLSQADEAIQNLATKGPFAAKAEPGLMGVTGMTLDHIIGFAEAGKLFYDAAPWHHLLDDDLIEIHSPAGPKGTRFTQVLGAGGQVVGLGFVASRAVHEQLQSGGELPNTSFWNLLFNDLDELPYDDGELWENHNLPVADDQLYPAFNRFTPARRQAFPKPKELSWAEGLLRALAATTEDELDSGRWEKSVETVEGPAVYSFSLPILLEQMQAAHSGEGQSVTESPQVMMERLLRGFRQEAAKRNVQTPEDLDRLAEDFQSGKSQPISTPQAPAEQAQELCFQARSARGRRQVQLARQALAIDPDCCDALVMLATRYKDADKQIPLLRQAVAAGERSLGATFFEENGGHFWGVTETRPYMRAKHTMAIELLNDGQVEEAIIHLKKLLELNPNDNQGNRYFLCQALLSANRLDELDQLLNQSAFSTEESPEWAFTRTLLEYRRHADAPITRQRLAEAVRQNAMVVPLLTGEQEPPDVLPTSYAMGSVEEAITVAEMIGDGWTETPGALTWLKSMTDRTAKKAKVWERDRKSKNKKRRR